MRDGLCSLKVTVHCVQSALRHMSITIAAVMETYIKINLLHSFLTHFLPISPLVFSDSISEKICLDEEICKCMLSHANIWKTSALHKEKELMMPMIASFTVRKQSKLMVLHHLDIYDLKRKDIYWSSKIFILANGVPELYEQYLKITD